MTEKHKTREELLRKIEDQKAEIKGLRKKVSDGAQIQVEKENSPWQNSEVLRTILKNSIPVIFMIDKEGIFTVSEGTDLQTLGLEPGEVVGQSAYELYQDNPAIINGIKTALAGNHYRAEISVGDQVFDVFYSPYHDTQGNIPGIIGMAVNVTGRVNAINELRRLTEIVEQSTDGIIYTDTQYRIMYINDAARKLFGWSLEEIRGNTPGLFNAEPLSDEYQQKIYDTVSKGETFNGEALNVRKDGSTFYCEMKISAVTDPDGTISGYMSMVRDVTERREMIAEILSSRRRYQSLMNQANDAIFITDAGSGQLLDANQKAQELIGRPLEEIQQMHQSELHPVEDEDHYRTIFQEHYQQGETGIEAVYLAHKDGHHIPVEMRSSVIEIDGHKVVQGIFRDISQRLESEEQMRLQSLALNAAANGIMITDTGGKIIWVNPAFSALTGYTPDEIIGKTPSVLNSGVHPPEFFNQLWKTISSGKVWEGQIINRRKDGRNYVDEQTITPVFDHRGQNTHFIAIKQDITERIRAEKNLKRKLSESSILEQISTAGAALLDEDEFIETVTSLIGTSFYSDHLGVLLLDETETFLYPHPSYIGITPEDYSKKVGVGEGISGKVAQTGKPMLLSDVSANPDYISTLNELRSEICVPLVVSDKVIGVINVESKKLNAFSHEDLQLLTTISSQ